ncbi:MAG: hypothetical protein IJC59_03610 [Lachnospiraceae bacterium]|nr:hypothetical protein [Lachnospiraceae bacterium]
MRVTEKLILENQRKRRMGRPDEEEETLTYLSRQKRGSINEEKRQGFGSRMNTGINAGESSFDAKATFRT